MKQVIQSIPAGLKAALWTDQEALCMPIMNGALFLQAGVCIRQAITASSSLKGSTIHIVQTRE